MVFKTDVGGLAELIGAIISTYGRADYRGRLAKVFSGRPAALNAVAIARGILAAVS